MSERVPGESYSHGTRIKCLVLSVRKGMRGPQITLTRVAPQPGQEAVRPRGARDRQRAGRDRRHRPRGRPPHQDRGVVRRGGRQPQGRLHRADGAAGAQRDGRAARREDRHRRLVRGPRRAGRPRPLPGPGEPASTSSTSPPSPRASSCRRSSCRSRSARRARTPASPPASPAGGSTSTATRKRRTRACRLNCWWMPAIERRGPRQARAPALTRSSGTRWSSAPVDHSGKSKTASISCIGYVGGRGQRRTTAPSTVNTAPLASQSTA